MNLTLTVDDEVFRRAEQLASARKMTVSEMVERLLRVLAEPAPKVQELAPNTRAASGMLSKMTDSEVEAIIDESRAKKFGIG
jgi:predicted CopG family antitoxin